MVAPKPAAAVPSTPKAAAAVKSTAVTAAPATQKPAMATPAPKPAEQGVMSSAFHKKITEKVLFICKKH